MAPRKFSDEFKSEAVRAVIESSLAVVDVAKEHGIGTDTLRNWVNKHRREHAGNEPELKEPERAELTRLRKENRDLKMEQEFLKSGGLLRDGITVSVKYAFIHGVEHAWCESNRAPNKQIITGAKSIQQPRFPGVPGLEFLRGVLGRFNWSL